ncbi:MBL fold metallo-hydrolase [Solibacillus sp. FSL H8-0538]|uniref:MBL fold metallo-hydrolase n=1 Tax=Solibacillus sp. FSL H8-0538 TaxID=2921400 RepID=UPI0030FC34A1
MLELFKVGKKTVYPIIYDVNYGQMKSINCYLLDDGDKLTLIDAGLQHEKYIEFFDAKLAEYGFTFESIDQILLTHHHEDHTGQVNRIIEHKAMPVFAHHLAIERVHFEQVYLHKKQDFFIRLYEEYGCSNFASERFKKMANTLLQRDKLKLTTDVQPLYADDLICGMKVIEVPGHSPDSIVFYDEETKWLFAGDLVLKSGSTNALIDFDEKLQLLPTVAQYEESLKRCRKLATSVVFAGHQAPFSNHAEIIEKNLARIARKYERIVRVVENGHHQAMDIAHALYGERLEKEFSLIMSEVIGYLYYAERQCKLSKTMKDGEWVFNVK